MPEIFLTQTVVVFKLPPGSPDTYRRAQAESPSSDDRMDISQRRAGRAWLARVAVFGLLLFASGCGENYPQSTLVPHSDITRMIDSVFRTTFWWAMVVFVPGGRAAVRDAAFPREAEHPELAVTAKA
ncbi:MAG: hypothetical protein R2882_07685 [Gemmatimonadales bacterium]